MGQPLTLKEKGQQLYYLLKPFWPSWVQQMTPVVASPPGQRHPVLARWSALISSFIEHKRQEVSTGINRCSRKPQNGFLLSEPCGFAIVNLRASKQQAKHNKVPKWDSYKLWVKLVRSQWKSVGPFVFTEVKQIWVLKVSRKALPTVWSTEAPYFSWTGEIQ